MATFRIWRGDAERRPVRGLHHAASREGMVVLDAVHQIQADAGQRPGRAAGTARPASAAPAPPRSTASRALMCMTRMAHAAARPADHPRADAGLPAHQGPGDGRVVELPGQEADQAVQAAAARRPRRHLAHEPGRRRSRPGVPQVHRVLPVPGRLPRPARSPPARASSSARASWSTSPPWRCTRSTPRTGCRSLKKAQGIGLLQHHQVLHQGLPGEHHHHRQRHHSAQGARGG